MPREYRHIEEYEREIIEQFNNGVSLREIGERLGFTHRQCETSKPDNKRGWKQAFP